MSALHYYDGLAAYEHGYQTCAKNQRGVIRAWLIVMLLALLLALCTVTEQAKQSAYRQGQIDAAEGIQHFYPVRQNASEMEWFDDRETTIR